VSSKALVDIHPDPVPFTSTSRYSKGPYSGDASVAKGWKGLGDANAELRQVLDGDGALLLPREGPKLTLGSRSFPTEGYRR
jgi:hypothetical protein